MLERQIVLETIRVLILLNIERGDRIEILSPLFYEGEGMTFTMPSYIKMCHHKPDSVS